MNETADELLSRFTIIIDVERNFQPQVSLWTKNSNLNTWTHTITTKRVKDTNNAISHQPRTQHEIYKKTSFLAKHHLIIVKNRKNGGIGKTGVKLRYHTRKEYGKFNWKQRSELHEWRKSSKGGSIIANKKGEDTNLARISSLET